MLVIRLYSLIWQYGSWTGEDFKRKGCGSSKVLCRIGWEEFEPIITRIRAQGVTTKPSCSVFQTYILPFLSHLFLNIVRKRLRWSSCESVGLPLCLQVCILTKMNILKLLVMKLVILICLSVTKNQRINSLSSTAPAQMGLSVYRNSNLLSWNTSGYQHL